ncbi:MAG: replicative DNA helicase [Brevinematia bacterium]
MAYDELLKKVPPYSIEAEQACLGVMLFSPVVVPTVLESLNEDDFYDERHRLIFGAIYELYDVGSLIDVVTVSERLQATNKLAKAGGLEYLSRLIELIPSYSNVSAYVKIILNRSILRNLLNASRRIMDLVYESDKDDIEKICDEAERIIFEVTHRRLRSDYKLINEIISETLAGIDRVHKAKHIFTGLPTGFTEFDEKTSGLQNGDLVVIAARPSMGKTAFALSVAANVARVKGQQATAHQNAVLIFSLEMSFQELALRMLSSEAGIDMQRLRKGDIKEGEWDELTAAAGRLSFMQILVDDTPAISLNEIRAKSRRVKSKYNLKLIIIDHLQLVTTSDSSKVIINRNAEISYISRSLKALAKELNIPVLVLSQLSRAVENRTDKRPILSDLRESGAIEQDADVVAFLFRESYYDKESTKGNTTELIIQKQRNGPTGTVELAFLSNIVKFENLAKHGDIVKENGYEINNSEF